MRLTCIPRGAGARCCRALALPLLTAACLGTLRGHLVAQAAAAGADTLRQPPIARNLSRRAGLVEVEITAAPARIPLLPGSLPANVYAYNGSIPGPTIEAHEGDSVVIHFRNRLPEPTTVHWHGVHLPANADGSPLYPIQPGSDHAYAFRIAAGSAGTYWYHPHADATTTRQVALGLYGAIIVRPANDPLAGVPEKLLVLSDNRLNPDGSVAFPAPGSVQASIDMENGREGDRLFVNGQIMPRIVVASGEVQRWRIVNASAARVYRLALPDQRLLHVGDDGGLFERPVETPSLVLANSERVEVLVRGQAAGAHVALEDLPYDRYAP
ncbi:MAG TPA: multicopper oxidase family protein, partial [Longimicrobiales bacterium]